MLPYMIKGLVVVIKGRDLEIGEIILDYLGGPNLITRVLKSTDSFPTVSQR